MTGGSGPLTSEAFWARHWESLGLPYSVDRKSYRFACYDRLFHRSLPSGRRSILEVGSGACQWLAYFTQEFGYEAWGLDYSLVACRIGHRNLELMAVPPRVTCGDLFAPPFRRRFDVVFTDGVIEHFADFRGALRATASLVEPGGLLITTVPNFAGWFGRSRRLLDAHAFEMHTRITSDALEAAARDAGLVEICVSHFGSLRFPRTAHGEQRTDRLITTAFRLAGEAADRGLLAAYRLSGRSIEGPRVSAEIYAIAKRPLG